MTSENRIVCITSPAVWERVHANTVRSLIDDPGLRLTDLERVYAIR